MPAVVCRTKDQFKQAVARREELIRIEDSDLAMKTRAVLAIPAASFAVAAGFIAVALGITYSWATAPADLPATGGASGVLRFGGKGAAMAGATAALGGPAAAAAMFSVGLAVGGAGMLRQLHNDYRVTDSGSDYVVLTRK